jgi:hypothetical protein
MHLFIIYVSSLFMHCNCYHESGTAGIFFYWKCHENLQDYKTVSYRETQGMVNFFKFPHKLSWLKSKLKKFPPWKFPMHEQTIVFRFSFFIWLICFSYFFHLFFICNFFSIHELVLHYNERNINKQSYIKRFFCITFFWLKFEMKLDGDVSLMQGV